MNTQRIFLFDGSFEGLLSCIYCIYTENVKQFKVIRTTEPVEDLFIEKTYVQTDLEKARRVWDTFIQKTSRISPERVLLAYLSDKRGEEQTIVQYIKYMIDSKRNQEQNLENTWVRRMKALVEDVHLERLRIKSILKFELLENSIYYAEIHSKYNVLPLISFELSRRTANKPWIIYDNDRNYGVHFNLVKLKEMKVEIAENAPSFNIFQEDGLLLSVLKTHKHLNEQQVLVSYEYFSKMSNALIPTIA